MSTLLPYDSSEGSVSVTQAIHDFFPGGSYSPLLYYSFDFDLEQDDQILSISVGVVVSVVNFVIDGIEMAGSNNTDTYPQYGPGGTGNQITIYYDDLGLYVTYAHLEQGSIPFIEGDTVSQGDVIGEIGYTGIAIPTSFDHLHITYGITTTSWGTSTSNFYLGTTLIADGSTAQNGLPTTVPNGQSTTTALVFDESGVQLLEGANAPTSQNSANPVDRERSFNDALSENTIADDLDELTRFYLEANLAPNVSNVSFTGSGDAAFFVENLVGNISLSGLADLDGGIILSTGGYPGSSNSSSSFTVAHGTAGDSDLDQVLVDADFTGAGSTQDAVSIEFSINVTPGSDVDGISFDIVFGSEEYPEFSSSSFVDVAAIFVNGENYALFNDDPTTPLSVLNENVFSGNFIDNELSPFPSIYPIEWDGFSNVLTVRAPLQSGQNTIKIAIADTGDQSYDSGLYIQDMDLLYDGGTTGGILTVVNASISGGELFLTGLLEEVNLFNGEDTVKGFAANLNGDIIVGFAEGDEIVFQGVTFSKENVTIEMGSAILNVDSNQDGEVDTILTLAGDFEGSEFNFQNVNGDTVVTVEFPPVNSPPIAADDTFTADEDQTIYGDVLSDNGNGADSDPDGDFLTVSLISGTAEGILTLNDDGSFSYEADADVFDLAAPGDVIEQSFTYQIDDGNGEIDQATATISVTILDDGETFVGGNGRQTLIGTDGGEDLLLGENGDDELYGLDGSDMLEGGRGDDLLFGGEGPDFLFGGRGDDLLNGGLGDDELTGGKGDDTFILAVGEGTDTVLDYGVGEDLIGLDGLTFNDISIGQAGDDATISANGVLLAVLTGVEAASLNESDFFNFI